MTVSSALSRFGFSLACNQSYKQGESKEEQKSEKVEELLKNKGLDNLSRSEWKELIKPRGRGALQNSVLCKIQLRNLGYKWLSSDYRQLFFNFSGYMSKFRILCTYLK